MKNVLKPLSKSVLIPLGLTADVSAADAAIHKKSYESGHRLDLASRMATDNLKCGHKRYHNKLS